MTLTNNEIYGYASALLTEFGPDCEIKFPIKINFFLQKNIKLMSDLAQDIDASRLAIAQQYGTLNEDGVAYSIPDEKIEDAARELNDLFSLTQEVAVRKFNIDDFNDIELTAKQMNALMFMINDEE